MIRTRARSIRAIRKRVVPTLPATRVRSAAAPQSKRGPLLSSNFHFFKGRFWRSQRRGKPRSQVLGEGVDFLGVEHLVIALEQAGNGGPMNLHLGAADS